MYRKTFLLVTAGIILLACNTKEGSKSKSYEQIETLTGSWELVWNDEFDYDGEASCIFCRHDLFAR